MGQSARKRKPFELTFIPCLPQEARESWGRVTVARDKGYDEKAVCPGFLSGRLRKSQSMCKRREIEKHTAKNRFIFIFLAQATTALNGAT